MAKVLQYIITVTLKKVKVNRFRKFEKASPKDVPAKFS